MLEFNGFGVDDESVLEIEKVLNENRLNATIYTYENNTDLLKINESEKKINAILKKYKLYGRVCIHRDSKVAYILSCFYRGENVKTKS